ncbi:MAG: DUF808 domain-containing protein [Nocardioides sp.]
MSGGLVALLDDVAVLARMAAASIDDVGAAAARASMKSAGVVVDDTAVTPQYVHGVAANRELPIIWRIARGSLRNKLVFILPAALVLSQFLPVLVTPLLMLGAGYLCFEGAEKVWERIGPAKHASPLQEPGEVAATSGADAEEEMVASAIRTDFILSAEIMVIALNEVSGESFLSRAAILIVVAFGITALVYGVVGLIVKMDDIGLSLAGRTSRPVRAVGRTLVRGMPRLLALLSTVGVAAMLWVGGHILLVGTDDLGWHAPYDLVHDLEKIAHDAVSALGGVLPWLVNTAASAVVGLSVGILLVAALHLRPGIKTH